MKEVYLDNAATTAVRPEVMDAMLPCYYQGYGNPSSLHSVGQKAKRSLEEARMAVARALEADPEEIIFTSGGTEGNNLAIKGIVSAQRERGNHLITTPIEHHAALNVFQNLERKGFEVTYLPLDRHGLIDFEALKASINDRTIMISVMLANNEIGTIEPISEVSAIAREHGIAVHTDAVQAAGKIPLDVKELGVDLLTITAHKIYGPKGVGALYIRKGLKIDPLFEGGHQERTMRPGTENIPGIVGLATALRLALAELDSTADQINALRNRLEKEVLSKIGRVIVNGHPQRRIPNIASLSFTGVEGEALLLALDTRGIAVSTASACSAGSTEPSHVLKAIGLDPLAAQGTLRFSLGRQNNDSDIDHTVDILTEAVPRLRELSPVGD